MLHLHFHLVAYMMKFCFQNCLVMIILILRIQFSRTFSYKSSQISLVSEICWLLQSTTNMLFEQDGSTCHTLAKHSIYCIGRLKIATQCDWFFFVLFCKNLKSWVVQINCPVLLPQRQTKFDLTVRVTQWSLNV